MNRKPLYRHIDKVTPVPTAHGCGEKRVLLTGDETPSAVTQIARTCLKAGEIVETHEHPTMDEHFLFLKGEAEICADGIATACVVGDYALIPAGCRHAIRAVTDIEIITFGVALQ